MNQKKTVTAIAFFLAGFLVAEEANAAIALDRTRVIFDGGSKSMSLNISNENKELPYLAQGWIENDSGEKIDSPLLLLPPLQRVEPGAKSQLKIQATHDASKLPQDRESLFYFNLREIPPKSKTPNTLQIALQTRIKIFYRPKTLQATQDDYANPWQTKITLKRNGDRYNIDNPTPYYITIAGASSTAEGKDVAGFEPIMIPPKSIIPMKGNVSSLGNTPVLTYINDFGGRPKLVFQCANSSCQVRKNLPG